MKRKSLKKLTVNKTTIFRFNDRVVMNLKGGSENQENPQLSCQNGRCDSIFPTDSFFCLPE